MKKSIKFMLKLLVISMLFMAFVGAKSFAAEPVNLDNIEFTNIPENSGTTSTPTEDEAAKKKAEEEAAAKKKAEEEAAKKNTTTNTTNKTSTSSASKEKMPATGSNIEIIFIIGAAVLVSTAVILYTKQNIKLK